MSTPFLSIITINYNNAAGLRKTLESVKNQTSKNFEHIIIDGGSTDESVSVLNEFLADSEYKNQVAYWCSEKDKGVYDAMNKGIPHAKGEYCLFLNSGDFFADNEVVERFSRYGLTEDFVYTNALFFSSKKEWTAKYPARVTLAFFFGNRSLNHQNCLIKTSVQKEQPYSLDFKIVSDREFFMRLLMKESTTQRFVENDVIAKYENENGISTIYIEEIEQETKRLNDQYFSKQIQESFLYLYNENDALRKELSVYEKCWHGTLRKLKNLLIAYSRAKARMISPN